jgi:hypothetical protein
MTEEVHQQTQLAGWGPGTWVFIDGPKNYRAFLMTFFLGFPPCFRRVFPQVFPRVSNGFSLRFFEGWWSGRETTAQLWPWPYLGRGHYGQYGRHGPS